MTKAETIASARPCLDALVMLMEPNGIDARTETRRVATITPVGNLRIELHDWQQLDAESALALADFIREWFEQKEQA